MGREHRGPGPKDAELFAEGAVPRLRAAVADLSFLLGRGYAAPSSLALVGNRYALAARQRTAVSRAACSDAACARRRATHLALGAAARRDVHVDTLNALIVAESVWSGAPVFRGRDGSLRDLASVHGTWKRVEETSRAIDSLFAALAHASPRSVTFWIDRPVSNSGRLRGYLLEHASHDALDVRVELADDPDRVLLSLPGGPDAPVVATADSRILDGASAWIDLPQAVVAREAPDAWIIDLGDGADRG